MGIKVVYNKKIVNIPFEKIKQKNDERVIEKKSRRKITFKFTLCTLKLKCTKIKIIVNGIIIMN